MRIFHWLVACCLVISTSLVSSAQHYKHTTSWGKLTITTPLSKNWDFQFEYLHRSQNNPRQSLWNPFTHESIDEPRLWFFFKQKHYTVLLNPITYFYNEALLGKESDFNIKPNHIWQAVVGIEARQACKKWTIKERVLYEYRFLQSLNYVPIGRLRLRGLLQYQWTAKTKLQIYNDVFLNAPPHKLTNNFDQNWAMLSVIRQVTPKISFETGYMRNHRERPNRIEFDEENGFSFALNLKL